MHERSHLTNSDFSRFLGIIYSNKSRFISVGKFMQTTEIAKKQNALCMHGTGAGGAAAAPIDFCGVVSV